MDEHIKVVTMFQQVVKYNVKMTNTLFRLFNLEIKNKQTIEEKDRSIKIFKELRRRSRSSK